MTVRPYTQPEAHMLFPNNDAIFQYDNSPMYTARSVQSWFEEHEDAFQHLPWPALSPDLNIQPLWSVLDSRIISRFPLPSHKQLEDVLQEEWYSIPLETIQNLCESTLRWIQTVLQANGSPTPN